MISGIENIMSEHEQKNRADSKKTSSNPVVFMNNTFQPKTVKGQPNPQLYQKNSIEGSSVSYESIISKLGQNDNKLAPKLNPTTTASDQQQLMSPFSTNQFPREEFNAANNQTSHVRH